MAMMIKLALVALICIMVALPIAQAAISCGEVTQDVAPCFEYARSGGTVPADCCSGIRTLNDAAKTTDDRKQTCSCLKDAAGSVEGLDPDLVQGLPAQCNVNVPYKISISTNCNEVK